MNASLRSDSASSWGAFWNTSKPTACQRSWSASCGRNRGIASPARLRDQPKTLLIPGLRERVRQHSSREDVESSLKGAQVGTENLPAYAGLGVHSASSRVGTFVIAD